MAPMEIGYLDLCYWVNHSSIIMTWTSHSMMAVNMHTLTKDGFCIKLCLMKHSVGCKSFVSSKKVICKGCKLQPKQMIVKLWSNSNERPRAMIQPMAYVKQEQACGPSRIWSIGRWIPKYTPKLGLVDKERSHNITWFLFIFCLLLFWFKIYFLLWLLILKKYIHL